MRNQIRILYRHFLLRVVDLDLLSAHAAGDASRVLGQIASLLIFLSVLFSIPVIGVGRLNGARRQVLVEWSLEHFLIATTILVVGVLAILSWESLLPDRRDVFTLGPLPVAPQTVFLAKTAATSAALGLAVVALHAIAGLLWPLALTGRDAVPFVPTMAADRALPPARGADLESVLNTDLREAVQDGALSPGTGLGLVIGVSERGQRRILAYGAADPDSLFEIGSITKPLTGLLLAEMVERGEVKLEQPLRALLQPGSKRTTTKPEITLVDLATHHSGLRPMPHNFAPDDQGDPYASYGPLQLREYLLRRGPERGEPAEFRYSNLGYSLLGLALAERAGAPYAELLTDRILRPLGMTETAIALPEALQQRLLTGHNLRREPVPSWDLNAFAPAGGVRSTASDMLAFLEANLSPETIRASRSSIALAVSLSHEPRAEGADGNQIALAWFQSDQSGTYWHNGATQGYSSYTFFRPAEGYGAVILSNSRPGAPVSADVMGPHVEARMAGGPTIRISETEIPPRKGLLSLARLYLAYWGSMLAAGAFVLLCIVALQGVTCSLLPRRLFLALSPYLQTGAFCGLVTVYFAAPTVTTPQYIVDAQQGGLLAWSPSYWFLGVFQQLSGSPMLEPLAARAWTALGIVAAVAAITYFASYYRTLIRIAEQPDVAPASVRLSWPAPFGSALQRAIGQFSVRTILRSRVHRGITAFYLGVAFAMTIVFVKMPLIGELSAATNDNHWGQPSVPLIGSTILILGLAVIGARASFSMPLELPANWVFRVAPIRGGGPLVSAYRNALLFIAVIPVLALTAILLLSVWPWSQALAHLAVLSILGSILVDATLASANRIPFTCSYLPGRSNIHITFWVCTIAIMNLVARAAEFEVAALQDPEIIAVTIALLTLIAVLVRAWATARSSESTSPQFENTPSDEIVGLDLAGTRHHAPPSKVG